MIGVHVVGADLVASSFAQGALTIQQRTDALAVHHRQLLVAAIRAGVPRQTGGLAASYQADDLGVASEHPAAHRREVGFHGRDSLGRFYNDPPRPVVGPAAEVAERSYTLSLLALLETL